MRKRIQQLARGEFQYAKPLLSFSTEKVEIKVLEGKDYMGDFIISSTNHVPMRGIVCTLDARMECLTPQFEGEEVRIRYQFHSNGLIEGDIQKGEFCIICNQGEYNLSFVVFISKLYAETSVGKINNLSHFAKLARQNATEAQHLFYSKNFKSILSHEERKEQLLYTGLSQGGVSAQKVEEFLLGAKKKKPVSITLVQQKASFYGVTETIKETIELRRSSWGYTDISVRSDADFLRLPKKHLANEDFIGNVCGVEYYVCEDMLHAGRNFGRLIFEMSGLSYFFEVCASRREALSGEATIKPAHRDSKECRVRLLQLYIDYRLKRIVTGVWAKQSVEVLEHLMVLLPEEKLYPLMKAHALLLNKQRQEAFWIMEDYKRGCTDRETPEWGYYLYLCTLAEKEPSYVSRITGEIERLFKKNPKSSLLFGVLLLLEESDKTNNVKCYNAIARWAEQGNHSPYLYVEAYCLLQQDSYLLRKLGKFEISLLNWARRQGIFSEEIALGVMHTIGDLREFNRFAYYILEECYRVNARDEMLAVICSYLIRGQCCDSCYHEWYELGIEHDIRITGLYEAYMMTMDAAQVSRVPEQIQMYFQYDGALSYRQKAALFVNIIAGRRNKPEVYRQYHRAMAQFAMEQLEAGHIGDNLAVLYDEILRTDILNTELAQNFSDILFTHKLTCTDKHIFKAEIWHSELETPQTVSLTDGIAYFFAYTDNYVIILEDTEGNRFSESIPYQDEPLMHPELYLERCMKFAPDVWTYALAWYGKKDVLDKTLEEKERIISVLLEEKQIHTAFKQELLMELLLGYQQREYDFTIGDNTLKRYLEQTDLESMSVTVRRRLAQLLTEAHFYEKAYRMVQMDGYDYLNGAARAALCSYAITTAEFDEDDFLLGFAESTFLLDAYNDVILLYLSKFCNASTKLMTKLWRAAGKFQMDTFDLEERILTQLLYTTDYTPYVGQIYDSYCASGGSELVCTAYISYFADAYFRGAAFIPEYVFVQIQERYLNGKEINEACGLGLLKYLAAQEKLTEQQFMIADALLAEYIEKGIYFAFYRSFERELLLKYHLYDKFFMEYQTKSNRQVSVHFRIGAGEYQTEELVEMYTGIYVQKFILFRDEIMQYYITEKEGIEAVVTESGSISNYNGTADIEEGRYMQLNGMLLPNTFEDADRRKHQMANYGEMSRIVDEVFKLL